MTLVLSTADLRQVVDVPSLAGELRAAFAGHHGDGGVRVRERVSDAVTAIVLFPGIAAGVPAYTVKVHARNARRVPAMTGVMCLHDAATGGLVAVLASRWLTGVRTGLGAAVGADVLAPPGADVVGVVGAGTQGRAQLAALAALRPLSAVHVADVDPAVAAAYAEWAEGLGVRVTVHASADDVAAAADVLLIATSSREPVLADADVAHVTTVGSDEPGKTELGARLLDRALVVADDAELAGRVLPRVDTTLGAVLRGEHPGRAGRSRTVYSPVGLPLQDCVVAWHAYRNARAAGLGVEVDLDS